MAIFVYITKECRDEAQRHTLQDDLDKFKDRVERAQNARLLEPFPPSYLVKKKFGGRQGRLIAKQVNLDEHAVIVFLSVMIRGESAYENGFSRNHIEYGRQHFDGRYRIEELNRYVAERTATAPAPEKQPPSTEEYGYLLQALSHRQDEHADNLVCESLDWVTRCADSTFKNWHANLFDALGKIEGDEALGGKLTAVPGKTGWSVLSRSFPQTKTRFLLAPIVDGDATALNKLRGQYQHVLEDAAPSLETILRESRRAYPGLVLADGDLWMDLEKDPQANMALSPEETELLAAARRTEGGFPLFINGRAGSGKTTILQYLFAEYLFYHLNQGELENPPVYFTCSAELLGQCQRIVETLLRCNAQWWHVEGRSELIKQNTQVMRAAFKEFHAHLLSLTDPKQRSDLFPPTKYVNYPRFRQMWMERFSKDPGALREYGPDISWHVIRSYVKGLSADELIDPEEYRQLDKKQITVTQESYERVHDKVWARWYKLKCENDKFWDDQDLARHLIEHDLVQPFYPAIFCDEAQDFTRLELEIILRLSLFSERKLAAAEIGRVPFVFAGDQFQTLNPTGFRWDAIKAAFVEKFILALDPLRRSRLDDLNYRELTHNYRSSRSIVCFSNFVQVLRARLFKLPGLTPQMPWTSEKSSAPVWRFNRENQEFWARLQKNVNDVAIIVPCGEGEELEYARRFLSGKVRFEENMPQVTVLSAIRAKGLEFNRVVVYGFGEAAGSELLSPLRGQGEYADDPDKSLPHQYFINRLYVAVSRAKHRLFVVDTDEGFRNLWQFAEQESLESDILDHVRDGRRIWEGLIARLEVGRPDDLDTEQASDPLENALNLATDGRARRDPYLLMAASVAYKNNGCTTEADICKAEAMEIEEKFLDAGNLFLSCGKPEQAVPCLWEAGSPGWAQLIKAAESHELINRRLEFAFARAINGKPAIATTKDLLSRLIQHAGLEDNRATVIASRGWMQGVQSLLDKLTTIEATPDEWQTLVGLVRQLADEYSLPIPNALRARLHFRAGQFGDAVKLWDVAKQTDSHEYKEAKAASSPYPEKIQSLFDLGKHSQVIAECETNTGVALTREQHRCVGQSYLKQRDLAKGLQHAIQSHDAPALFAVLEAGVTGRDERLPQTAASALFAVAVAGEKWADILRYLRKGTLPGTEAQTTSIAAWVVKEKPKLDVALARALARSDGLANLTWDDRKSSTNQRPIAEYLSKAFEPKNPSRFPREHAREIGAAIERAGGRIDSLAFYEMMANHDQVSDDDKIHARTRWIACKERQAKYESERGGEKVARIQMTEAEEARRRIGIPESQAIPSYPVFGSIEEYLKLLVNETTSTPQVAGQPETTLPVRNKRLTWTFGDLRFEYFQGPQKINISHANTGATATVKLDQNDCVGDDVVFAAQVEESTKKFEAKDWGLTIRFDGSNQVRFEFAADGFNMSLDVS